MTLDSWGLKPKNVSTAVDEAFEQILLRACIGKEGKRRRFTAHSCLAAFTASVKVWKSGVPDIFHSKNQRVKALLYCDYRLFFLECLLELIKDGVIAAESSTQQEYWEYVVVYERDRYIKFRKSYEDTLSVVYDNELLTTNRPVPGR